MFGLVFLVVIFMGTRQFFTLQLFSWIFCKLLLLKLIQTTQLLFLLLTSSQLYFISIWNKMKFFNTQALYIALHNTFQSYIHVTFSTCQRLTGKQCSLSYCTKLRFSEQLATTQLYGEFSVFLSVTLNFPLNQKGLCNCLSKFYIEMKVVA